MTTEGSTTTINFQPLASREVSAQFNGGAITSDSGGLLLREIEAKTGMLAELVQCFDDHPDPELIEHSVEDMLKQRIFGVALGYEDLNDHDYLRTDLVLATLVGKRDRVLPAGVCALF